MSDQGKKLIINRPNRAEKWEIAQAAVWMARGQADRARELLIPALKSLAKRVGHGEEAVIVMPSNFAEGLGAAVLKQAYAKASMPSLAEYSIPETISVEANPRWKLGDKLMFAATKEVEKSFSRNRTRNGKTARTGGARAAEARKRRQSAEDRALRSKMKGSGKKKEV